MAIVEAERTPNGDGVILPVRHGGELGVCISPGRLECEFRREQHLHAVLGADPSRLQHTIAALQTRFPIMTDSL